MSDLNELKEKYGELAQASIDGVTYAFRCPKQDEFEEYQAAVTRARDRKSMAGPHYRQLANQCCVTHNHEELDKLFQARPAAPIKICDVLAEMAGADIEFTVKKD